MMTRTIRSMLLATIFLAIVLAGCTSVSVYRGTRSYGFGAYTYTLPKESPEVLDLIRLGKSYFTAGEFRKAEEQFRKSVALSPSNIEGNFYTGLSLLHQNRREEGLDYLAEMRTGSDFYVGKEIRWKAGVLRGKPELSVGELTESLRKSLMAGFRTQAEFDHEFYRVRRF